MQRKHRWEEKNTLVFSSIGLTARRLLDRICILLLTRDLSTFERKPTRLPAVKVTFNSLFSLNGPLSGLFIHKQKKRKKINLLFISDWLNDCQYEILVYRAR